MRVNLSGRVALVTGSAKGIGRAIADRLAAEGASVVYSDIAAPLDAAAADPRHMALKLDVTDEHDVQHAIDAIIARYGKLDICVNNAGIGTAPADRVTIDKVRPEQWRRLIDVDLTGVFLVARAASAAMIPQKYGRIINISSVLGLVPMRLQSAYVAAKAGVANLTKGMAIELAQHGITVNAIAPGSTATDGWRNWINDATSEEKDLHARLMSHIPMGRPAETREIAHAALFLADPDSAFVTAQILAVDGGWIAGFARDF
jgi:NAD(P)-dependent dehydrogenase (short-subunit alcohol dehydrogenase family)